jgi:hypothetical protein
MKLTIHIALTIFAGLLAATLINAYVTPFVGLANGLAFCFFSGLIIGGASSAAWNRRESRDE